MAISPIAGEIRVELMIIQSRGLFPGHQLLLGPLGIEQNEHIKGIGDRVLPLH